MWKRLKDLRSQAFRRLRSDDAVITGPDAVATAREDARDDGPDGTDAHQAEVAQAHRSSLSEPAARLATPHEPPSEAAAAILGTMTTTSEAQVAADAEAVAATLADAVDLARDAAIAEADDRGHPAEVVGSYFGVQPEDEASATHLFEAQVPGYRGWRWEVTVACAGAGYPVTISEVLLRPGSGALVPKAWVPWERRVRAGDLGVGDILPTTPDDIRLVPGYVASDDPVVEETAGEIGLGRARVLSRVGRLQAAARWRSGEFGPRSDMARSAPESCGTCGFYTPLGGSLAAAFGVCCNEIAPADGHVVNAEYGCGAHSEIVIDQAAVAPVAELVYDDSLLDVEPHEPAPAAEPEPEQAPVADIAAASGESDAD